MVTGNVLFTDAKEICTINRLKTGKLTKVLLIYWYDQSAQIWVLDMLLSSNNFFERIIIIQNRYKYKILENCYLPLSDLKNQRNSDFIKILIYDI